MTGATDETYNLVLPVLSHPQAPLITIAPTGQQ